MYLHEISIPVSSYYGDEVFHQLLHFVTVEWMSPARDSVIDALKLLHARDSVHDEYTGTWKEAIEIVEACEEFPVTYHGVISTNHFVEHSKFGRQSIRAQTRHIVDMRSGVAELKLEF
jgi:hypothetical protein